MQDIKKSFFEATSINEDEIINVILGCNRSIMHCGISFHHKKVFKVLHLAWHNNLKLEDDLKHDMPNYYYFKNTIPRSRQKLISAMCRQIFNRDSQQVIPYGLIYNYGTFNSQGMLKLNDLEHGLTCATFVLAVFESCGIRLIDISKWKHRESDKEFHKLVIKNLIYRKDADDISDEHISNVKGELGCSRFRPEEVAVSSTLFNTKPSFSKVTIHGEVINSFISRTISI